MRALLFLFPLLFASCAGIVSQREILKRSKAEIAAREPWADTAVILVEQKPDDYLRLTWRVSAGAFDLSEYPKWTDLNLVPGTERELCFTRDGCLLRYSEVGSRCPMVEEATMGYTDVPAEPAK